MSDGRITAEYGANWMGCYALLDHLVKAKLGQRGSLSIRTFKSPVLHPEVPDANRLLDRRAYGYRRQ